MDSEISIHTKLSHLLADYPDESRVWVFQSNRKLAPDSVDEIQQTLNEFSKNWTSHARELKATIILHESVFIIVVLDQTNSNSASGCSIDSLTSAIQNIGKQWDYDFMNRDLFYFHINQEPIGIKMNLLQSNISEGIINSRSLVYDSLVKTKAQLSGKWLVPLEESWHHRFL